MSTIKAEQWLNTDGTENYKCRAWVNFNGTGVVAIRASGNVSSITDNGTGNYTVNFINAMPDADYSPVGFVSDSVPAAKNFTIDNVAGIKTASAFQAYTTWSNATTSRTPQDVSDVDLAIFR